MCFFLFCFIIKHIHSDFKGKTKQKIVLLDFEETNKKILNQSQLFLFHFLHYTHFQLRLIVVQDRILSDGNSSDQDLLHLIVRVNLLIEF